MAKHAGEMGLMKRRSFLGLWLGQLISSLGDHLLHINAIAFALAAHKAAGGAMAQILVWATIPSFVIGLIAGVVTDRVNRKSVMVISDVMRAGLIALLPWAAHVGFWMVCALMALVAAAASFFGPARTSLIPVAVPKEQLVAANAWFSVSGFLVALVGTAAGGWLLVWLGPVSSLWVNAAIFGGSALAIALVGLRDHAHAAARPASMAQAVADLREGCRFTARHRLLRTFTGYYAVLMLLATAMYVGLVGLASAHGARAMQGMSALLTAGVIGLLIGGVMAARWCRRLSAHRLIAIGFSTMALGAFGLAVAPSLPAMMGCVAVVGVGAACATSVVEATLQRVTPQRLQGRVIATRGVVGGLAVLGGALGAGWVSDHVGRFALFGGMAALGALTAITMQALTPPGMLFRATRWFFRQLGFAYMQLHIGGLQQIPKHGPAILAGNHPNVMDGLLLLMVSPRPVRFLVAEELFFHRYLYWFFKGMGCIPVYRTRTHNGDALRAALAALRRGEVIGIFPEGTTAYLGDVRAIKRGVGLLALKTGAPVVPFGIRGSAELYPQGARVPRPGRITMAFAPAVRYHRIDTPQVPAELLQHTLEDIRWELVRSRRWAATADDAEATSPLKRVQVALSALILLPLAGFLSLTSNPSLDPVTSNQATVAQLKLCKA